MCNKLIKFILKRFYTRSNRELRTILVGKRLKAKQHIWLYFNNHPWESSNKQNSEEDKT